MRISPRYKYKMVVGRETRRYKLAPDREVLQSSRTVPHYYRTRTAMRSTRTPKYAPSSMSPHGQLACRAEQWMCCSPLLSAVSGTVCSSVQLSIRQARGVCESPASVVHSMATLTYSEWIGKQMICADEYLYLGVGAPIGCLLNSPRTLLSSIHHHVD